MCPLDGKWTEVRLESLYDVNHGSAKADIVLTGVGVCGTRILPLGVNGAAGVPGLGGQGVGIPGPGGRCGVPSVGVPCSADAGVFAFDLAACESVHNQRLALLQRIARTQALMSSMRHNLTSTWSTHESWSCASGA